MSDETGIPIAVRKLSPGKRAEYLTEVITSLACRQHEEREERERLAGRVRELGMQVARVRQVLADEPPVDPAAVETFQDGWQAGHRRMAETVVAALDGSGWFPPQVDFASEIQWFHDVGDERVKSQRCPVGDFRHGMYRSCDVREDSTGRPVRHVWRRVWYSRPRPGVHGDDGTLTLGEDDDA